MTKDEALQIILLAKLSNKPVTVGKRTYLPVPNGWNISTYIPATGAKMLMMKKRSCDVPQVVSDHKLCRRLIKHDK